MVNLKPQAPFLAIAACIVLMAGSARAAPPTTAPLSAGGIVQELQRNRGRARPNQRAIPTDRQRNTINRQNTNRAGLSDRHRLVLDERELESEQLAKAREEALRTREEQQRKFWEDIRRSFEQALVEGPSTDAANAQRRSNDLMEYAIVLQLFEEERVHRDRLARIDRIQELSRQEGSPARLEQLLALEQEQSAGHEERVLLMLSMLSPGMRTQALRALAPAAVAPVDPEQTSSEEP